MREAVISRHLSRRQARKQESRLQMLLQTRYDINTSDSRKRAIVSTMNAYKFPEWARGVKVRRRKWGFQWEVVATENRGH